MPPIVVTRTYLQLRGPEALRRGQPPGDTLSLARLRPVRAAEYRALYTLVGGPWMWRDRLAWSDDALDAYLASPGVQVWVARAGAEVAGYFELRELTDGDVEIVYFGLVAAFIGRRLGGWLLVRACEIAFALGARHVALNTCTLDSPHALPNYLARGFTIVREEEYEVTSDE